MFIHYFIPFFIAVSGVVFSSTLDKSEAHEFHISNCEIEHLAADKSITIVLHLFIDDLELNLKNLGYDSLYISTGKESERTNDILGSYFKEKLNLTADAEKINLIFLGKETSEDLMAIWCYLEATDIPDFNEITIENKILLDTYSDQKNITSFLKSNGKKIHFLFEKGDEIQSLKY